MGYTNKGVPKKPEVNWDLRDELPADDTAFDAMKRGFIKIGDVITPTMTVGIIDSEGNLLRNVEGDVLSDIYDSFVNNTPGGFTALYEHLTKYDTRSAYVLKDHLEDQDTTSQAAKEWTVGAGKVWIVLALIGMNSTRASNWRVSLTPDGGSELVFNRAAGALGYETNYLTTGAVGTAGHTLAGFNLIVLDAGDKIKLNNVNFVAADTMKHGILYVELTP